MSTNIYKRKPKSLDRQAHERSTLSIQGIITMGDKEREQCRRDMFSDGPTTKQETIYTEDPVTGELTKKTYSYRKHTPTHTVDLGQLEPGSHPKRMTREVREVNYHVEKNANTPYVEELTDGTMYIEVRVPVMDQRPMMSDRRGWVEKGKLGERYRNRCELFKRDMRIAQTAKRKRNKVTERLLDAARRMTQFGKASDAMKLLSKRGINPTEELWAEWANLGLA